MKKSVSAHKVYLNVKVNQHVTTRRDIFYEESHSLGCDDVCTQKSN